MAKDLAALRALLKDHIESDEALTLNAEVCLMRSITKELTEATSEKEARLQLGEGSMAAGTADTSEVDAKIAEIEQRFLDHSITLHFRAVTDRKYREILDGFPDADANQEVASQFWNALAVACYTGATHGGDRFDPDDMPVVDIFDSLTFGEVTHIRQLVFTMNRSEGSRPFLSKRSRANRSG